MKLAFLTDEHVPYQDDRARQVALKILSEFDPDLVVTGSDGLDFYGLSVFDKNPERIKLGLQEEINLWQQVQLEWISATERARRIFIIGNHEDRLRKYLWRHPEIAELDAMRLENLLELEKLGIETHVMQGPNEVVLFDKLAVRHGKYVRQASGASAKAELEHERYSISLLTGHTHRVGSYFSRTRDGVVEAHECGCLCNLDPEYVRRPDWQQGFALAEVSSDKLFVELVRIETFRNQKGAIWRGKEYKE